MLACRGHAREEGRTVAGGGAEGSGGGGAAPAGEWWGNDSMEVNNVEGLADEEVSDDEDADTEEIRKLKVSCLGYMLINVH